MNTILESDKTINKILNLKTLKKIFVDSKIPLNVGDQKGIKDLLKYPGNKQKFISNLLNKLKYIPTKKQRKDVFKKMWNEYYNNLILKKGVKTFLEYCNKNGIKIILISDSNRKRVKRVIIKTNINHHFNIVIASDKRIDSKQTLKPFKKALRLTKSHPKDCLMIGDEEKDKLCKRIGIPFIDIKKTSFESIQKNLKKLS